MFKTNWMKKGLTICLLFVLSLSQAQTILTVGPGQEYVNIQVAYDSIPATISSAYEIHLMAGYEAKNDTCPIVFNHRFGSSESNTISIIPQVADIELFPDSFGVPHTIEFDSCSYVILDGRVGGIGDTANLRLRNHSTLYNTMVLNDASNNIIRYCNIGTRNDLAQTPSMIRLNGASQNNVLERNLMHGIDGNVPDSLLVASSESHNNTLLENYFFEGDGIAVFLEGNCTGWQVEGNHIYAGPSGTSFDFIYAQGSIVMLEVVGNYYGGSGPF